MPRALFVCTPAESKRLIGKAVAMLPEVQHAFKYANLLIGHGTTNVYLLEELLGKKKLYDLMDPATYVSGIVKRSILCATEREKKPPIVLIKRGAVVPPPDTMSEILRDFKSDSIVVKGANAIDSDGNAGVLVAHPEGGTAGWAIGTIMARGIPLIAPAGLEKLVPSVKQAAAFCGQETLDYCQGMPVGMIVLTNAKVVTEIEAIKTLTGVDAFHVASGGVNGSEGAVILAAEGDQPAISKTIDLLESIKGEPVMTIRENLCEKCSKCAPSIMEKFGSH